MTRALHRLDRWLGGRPPGLLLALSLMAVAAIGSVDFTTGYEVSLGLFYVAPVALAAWYVGRGSGVGLAVASSIAWYLADTGHGYSHPAFQAWNALIRLGFFLLSGLLLSALRASLDEQQRLARSDSLTGLANRRAFDDRLEHDLALAQRLGHPVSLAYIDLDDFKRINDEHGHAGGDRVLLATARVLAAKARRADTVARLGGDEFAVIMPDTDAAGARHIAAGLRQQLQGLAAGAGQGPTCSIGVITFLDPRIPVAAAVASADAVMYAVKRGGKGAIGCAVQGEAAQGGAARPEVVIEAAPPRG